MSNTRLRSLAHILITCSISVVSGLVVALFFNFLKVQSNLKDPAVQDPCCTPACKRMLQEKSFKYKS